MKICACTKNVQEMESDLNTSVDKSSLTPFTPVKMTEGTKMNAAWCRF
jgi:hypothetical protein